MEQDPKFQFDFNSHRYTYDGNEEPSVTQLLQEFGLIDFTGVPRDRIEHKRQIGTAVHLACRYLDDNNLDESTVAKPLVPYIEAYKKFREIVPFEPNDELTETPLRSKKWRFCGTPDRQGLWTCHVGGEEALVDLKCTWVMYRSVGPQLRGYKILIEENYPIKIKKMYGLQLKPTGNFDLVEFKDRTDENDFLACVHLYWAKRQKYKTEGKGNGYAANEGK